MRDYLDEVCDAPDELGFGSVTVNPEVRWSDRPDALHHWFVEPAMSHFRRIGAFSPDEADRFLQDLAQRAADGHYFSSLNSYSIIASR